MTWRARSASDKSDDWPLWYVTDDSPKDYNRLPHAFECVMGKPWPPVLPFVPRQVAEAIADAMNARLPPRQRL
jgi:hypothetical protein